MTCKIERASFGCVSSWESTAVMRLLRLKSEKYGTLPFLRHDLFVFTFHLHMLQAAYMLLIIIHKKSHPTASTKLFSQRGVFHSVYPILKWGVAAKALTSQNLIQIPSYNTLIIHHLRTLLRVLLLNIHLRTPLLRLPNIMLILRSLCCFSITRNTRNSTAYRAGNTVRDTGAKII